MMEDVLVLVTVWPILGMRICRLRDLTKGESHADHVCSDLHHHPLPRSTAMQRLATPTPWPEEAGIAACVHASSNIAIDDYMFLHVHTQTTNVELQCCHQ